jgi:hypothetical protein
MLQTRYARLLDVFAIHFNREDLVAKTSGASNGITVAAEAVGSALGRVAERSIG